MKPHPSDELLEKVRCIAYTKSMVSLRYKGEFNRFGVYVQSKDIYGRDVDKTVYMAGGKFISKLKFTESTKAVPPEVPNEVFKDLDIHDPNYDRKYDRRYKRYLDEYLKPEVIVNKYEPGDWENKLDLLYRFTLDFQEKYKGQDYP